MSYTDQVRVKPHDYLIGIHKLFLESYYIEYILLEFEIQEQFEWVAVSVMRWGLLNKFFQLKAFYEFFALCLWLSIHFNHNIYKLAIGSIS